jgi:hypothetical protein
MLGHADRGLGARRHARHIVLRHVDIDAQLARFGDHEQLRPPPAPTLISAPMSVSRAVTMPSNGAIRRLKPSSATSWSTFACAALTWATLAFQVKVRWSTSCLATASVLASDCQRSAVICASLALAWATLRAARACMSCWSRSGVSISASRSPAFTLLPMSCFQLSGSPGRARRWARDIGLQAPGQVQARIILYMARRHDRHDRHGLRFGQIVQARVLRRARAQAVGDDGDGEQHECAAHLAQPVRQGAGREFDQAGTWVAPRLASGIGFGPWCR